MRIKMEVVIRDRDVGKVLKILKYANEVVTLEAKKEPEAPTESRQ